MGKSIVMLWSILAMLLKSMKVGDLRSLSLNFGSSARKMTLMRKSKEEFVSNVSKG